MRKPILILGSFLMLFLSTLIYAQDNPVSLEWLAANLKKESPRLILTSELEAQIKDKLETDPIVKDYYRLLKLKADATLNKAPLVYDKKGRRLLGVSREALRRVLPLALLAHFEKDPKYIARLEKSLQAVCSFSDWNPSHFLDVAEMAAAVSFAIDWCGDLINPSIKEKAINALIENALKPSIAIAKHNGWKKAHHNWNLVCFGGMTTAALTVFEKEPELASLILHQAVENVPLALEPYAPDGIYPEGPSYWRYATSYLTLLISVFESALQTDFDFSTAPGLMESADYTLLTAGPSKDYFNFFDANTNGYLSLGHYGLLNWFENKGGRILDKNAYQQLISNQLNDPDDNNRFLGLFFLFLCQSDNDKSEHLSLPDTWLGEGNIPIGVFNPKDENEMYLAAKGGRAADNHGNMDAGSFILEWHKIRFGVDPGNQDYNTLEQIIGAKGLWDRSQKSVRWTLLTKNNFGHNTLTINGEKHVADARATLVNSQLDTETPHFTFDLTPVFGNSIQRARRTFTKLGTNVIGITDQLIFAESTEEITWQFMTTADVKIRKKDIELRLQEHQLKIKTLDELPYETKIIELSPPPLAYDKDIKNLKRIEIKFKREDFEKDRATIKVVLEGIK